MQTAKRSILARAPVADVVVPADADQPDPSVDLPEDLLVVLDLRRLLLLRPIQPMQIRSVIRSRNSKRANW